MFKSFIATAAICVALVSGAEAKTLIAGESVMPQNSKWTAFAGADQTLTLTMSAPYATPCGNGDWSGCGYQANGQLLAVENPSECGGWCGVTIGSFYIDAYKPLAQIVIDTNAYLGKFFVLHFVGQNPTLLTWNAVDTGPVIEAPAPVPVPAAGGLMAAGLGALAMLRRRNKAAA